MLRSLVGSEMCIRDSIFNSRFLQYMQRTLSNAHDFSPRFFINHFLQFSSPPSQCIEGTRYEFYPFFRYVWTHEKYFHSPLSTIYVTHPRNFHHLPRTLCPLLLYRGIHRFLFCMLYIGFNSNPEYFNVHAKHEDCLGLTVTNPQGVKVFANATRAPTSLVGVSQM